MMRLGVFVVIWLLLGGSLLSKPQSVCAQGVTTIKHLAGEKKRKLKEYPLIHGVSTEGKDILDAYLGLQAESVLLSNGRRVGGLYIYVSCHPENGATVRKYAFISQSEIATFQTRLDDLLRIAKQRRDNPERDAPLLKFNPAKEIIIALKNVEITEEDGSSSGKTTSLWMFFVNREPAPYARFGSGEIQDLGKFKQQVDQCVEWLNRKTF